MSKPLVKKFMLQLHEPPKCPERKMRTRRVLSTIKQSNLGLLIKLCYWMTEQTQRRKRGGWRMQFLADWWIETVVWCDSQGLTEGSRENLAEALATTISVDTTRALATMGGVGQQREVHDVVLSKIQREVQRCNGRRRRGGADSSPQKEVERTNCSYTQTSRPKNSGVRR